jgi:hypothetical protein
MSKGDVKAGLLLLSMLAFFAAVLLGIYWMIP